MQLTAYLGVIFGIVSVSALIAYAFWSIYMYLSLAISTGAMFPPLKNYSSGEVFPIILGFVVSALLSVGIAVTIVFWIIWSFETVWGKR